MENFQVSRAKDTAITLAVAVDIGSKAVGEVIGGALASAINGSELTNGAIKVLLASAIRKQLDKKMTEDM